MALGLSPRSSAEMASRSSAEKARRVAVSYTHLDVYKRQLIDGRSLLSESELSQLGVLKLQECMVLELSLIHIWEFCRKWLVDLGLKEENLRLRDHEPEELAFYSKATSDFEFMFPFGWGELWGVADRTDVYKRQVQSLAVLAMFTAILFLLTFTPIGMIDLPIIKMCIRDSLAAGLAQ